VGQEEAPQHAVLLQQEAGRLAQSEAGRDAHQLLARHRAGEADPDRQVDAAQLDLSCPMPSSWMGGSTAG
jgi:hypothetical protein